MKKLIGLLLAMALLAALAMPAMAEDQGKVMYVYTQNGKDLLVRSSMSTTEDNVVGSLPFGAKVITYGSQSGWTHIDYGDGSFSPYVMSRFLVKTKPTGGKPSDSKSSSGTDSKNFDTTSATTVEQINTLLASAKVVEPYSVTVRPIRASGWVYMRWIPSRHGKQIATYGANQQLTVIAELKDWYQVQDPATGRVGFVYKSYIQ